MLTGRITAVLLVGLGAMRLLGQMPAGGAQPDQKPMQMPMGGMGAHAKAMQPAGPLRVTFGGKSAEWTAEKLAALPHTNVKVYNEHAKAEQSYSGVPLMDLLTQLGVPATPSGKELRMYLVAVGSDGYEVVYSLGEVVPAVHDATVIVADSMDGKPLGDSGPLQLIATGEKHPSRWVRSLVAIRVMTAE